MNTPTKSLEVIRVTMDLPKREMARRLGISLDRYNRLVTGESKMLATEMITLHKISGVPYEEISIKA